MIKNSIYIPIAACDERFIEQTIRSALLNAKDPDNIFFGIFNNITNQKKSLLNNDFITKHEQIFYTEILTPCPMGVGFGRMNASLLQFKKFEYMFQIDAHTLFTKNWDEQIIDIFNKIKNENNIDENKIILSASPSIKWFNFKDDPYKIMSQHYEDPLFEIDPYALENYFKEKIKSGLSKIKFVYDGMQGKSLSHDNVGFPIVYGQGDIKKQFLYEEINCVHASFMFSKSNLNREVLHDPEDFFDGDQTNYSIRLLSRGYRIFCPRYPVIGTLNKQDEGIIYDELFNWRATSEYSGNNGSFYINNKKGDDRDFTKQILSGEYFGYWGTPDQESLKFTKRKIDYPE